MCRGRRCRYPFAYSKKLCLDNGAEQWSWREPVWRRGMVALQALFERPCNGYTLVVVASGRATNPVLGFHVQFRLLASSSNILKIDIEAILYKGGAPAINDLN
jgi:hypothetical protein